MLLSPQTVRVLQNPPQKNFARLLLYSENQDFIFLENPGNSVLFEMRFF